MERADVAPAGLFEAVDVLVRGTCVGGLEHFMASRSTIQADRKSGSLETLLATSMPVGVALEHPPICRAPDVLVVDWRRHDTLIEALGLVQPLLPRPDT